MLRHQGTAFFWERIAAFHMTDWWLVALIAPALIWMVERWPRKGLQFAAATALVPLKFWLQLPLLRLLWPQARFSLGQQLSVGFFPQLACFWAILAVLHALKYARSEAELEASLAEARLQALQLQLQPHFLFNTLHAISSLMHQDVEAASTMLAELGDLLRLLLNQKTQLIPLRDELKILDRYLSIMRVRFGDRLHVRLDVAPDVLGATVPTLLLQPVVENAIRHGVEKGAGTVEIAAHRETDRLRLSVRDDGPGATRLDGGVGLANLRERLRTLYDGRHQLDFLRGADGGLEVRIQLPFEAAA